MDEQHTAAAAAAADASTTTFMSARNDPHRQLLHQPHLQRGGQNNHHNHDDDETMRQARNRAVLRDVDEARALVEEYHHRLRQQQQQQQDDDGKGTHFQLLQAQRVFLKVVEEELSLLPASWQEKMLDETLVDSKATAAGSSGFDEDTAHATMRRMFARKRQEKQLLTTHNDNNIASTEVEEVEDEEARQPLPPKPSRAQGRGPLPFVTPPCDLEAVALAAAMLQNAPPLLPDGKPKQVQRRPPLSDVAPDIRDMTPEERLAVMEHVVRLIEMGLSMAGGRLRAARLGYPTSWDGRIPMAVLQEERELYRLVKAGCLLEQAQQQHQTHTPNLPVCCLVFLHMVHFSARELLPLDLLQGVVDEAKVARYHRHFPRAAALWVTFRRHVRFLFRNRVLTASELGTVFADALLGDMSKRGKVEEERLYRKVTVLLGSMAAGLLEEEKEELAKRARQEEEEQKARAEYETGIAIPAATSESKPCSTTKKNKGSFLSRVLRWE